MTTFIISFFAWILFVIVVAKLITKLLKNEAEDRKRMYVVKRDNVVRMEQFEEDHIDWDI